MISGAMYAGVPHCSLINWCLFNNLRNAEVSQLDAFLVVEQDVVELDVPVQHTSSVAVAETVEHLLEYKPCFVFRQSAFLFDVV